MKKQLLARLLIFVALFGAIMLVRYWYGQQHKLPERPTASTSTTQTGSTQTGQQNNGVPQYALDVLQYVRRNGQAPEGFVGGREFQNREKELPAKASDGSRIRYSEWDVHPKVKGKNRGPERLVTGSDHSAWYTRDHYKNFTRID
ncbi:MAG: hypothetical protein IT269_13695 [Saprospiraceae bacterium]|nr:hypothetical protein [Saprospiraceae bacterium]